MIGSPGAVSGDHVCEISHRFVVLKRGTLELVRWGRTVDECRNPLLSQTMSILAGEPFCQLRSSLLAPSEVPQQGRMPMLAGGYVW